MCLRVQKHDCHICLPVQLIGSLGSRGRTNTSFNVAKFSHIFPFRIHVPALTMCLDQYCAFTKSGICALKARKWNLLDPSFADVLIAQLTANASSIRAFVSWSTINE